MKFVLLLTAVALTWPANGQIPIPSELRALPPWAGEENAAQSSPPHYVFRDANGQIVVSYLYPENPSQRITYRFWLPNRVDPHVVVSVTKSEESGQLVYTYNYALYNGPAAASSIVEWSIVGPANEEFTIHHPVWKGSNARVPVAPQALLSDAPKGAYLFWYAVNVPPLPAGGQLSGFTLGSHFSPGLTTAYASDGGILEEPGPGEFPEVVVQELIPLQRPHVWRKPFVTIGPRFAPGTPLPVILNAYRKDVASLTQQGILSPDSPYIRELQSVLSSTGSTLDAVFNRKISPQSPMELDLDVALRMSADANRSHQ